MTADVTATEVNALLRTAKTICPGDSSEDGDRQLTLLAGALVVAARSCGADIDALLTNVETMYLDAEKMEMVPLASTAG